MAAVIGIAKVNGTSMVRYRVSCEGCAKECGTFAVVDEARRAADAHNDHFHRYFVEVCVDCYFAHHYGATCVDGQWFAGESDEPCEHEPLGRIEEGAHIFDATDSETGEGIEEFAMSSCEGCGSHLGGARYRLMVVPVA